MLQPGTVLSTVCIAAHLIVTTTLEVHLIIVAMLHKKQTEAQRDQRVDLGSYIWKAAGLSQGSEQPTREEVHAFPARSPKNPVPSFSLP